LGFTLYGFHFWELLNMTLLARICTALFLSLLSVNALAQGSFLFLVNEEPAQPAKVNASDLIEVVQVLSLANASQLDSAALAQARHPDNSLALFVEEMILDHRLMQDALEKLACSKGVSLEAEDLTSTAKLVKVNVDRDFNILVLTAREVFRSAFLRMIAYQYQKFLKLYDQIDQLNQDEALKENVAVFRALMLKNLAVAQELQTAS
jgi:predicted outer membrane protein